MVTGAPMRRRDDWLLGQLPMGMLDDDFFVRFVSMFQDVATSLLAGADNIPNVVDVTVAPPALVRWLGSWVGTTGVDASLPELQQRAMVRAASAALAWRGTGRGLTTLLEALTGAEVEVVDGGAVVRSDDLDPAGVTPSVKVVVTSTGHMSGDELVACICDEVPANIALEVWVGDQQLHAGPVLPATTRGDRHR